MRRLRARLVNKAPLRAPDVDKLLKLLGIWDLGVGRSKFDRRKWTGLGDDANEFLVLGVGSKPHSEVETCLRGRSRAVGRMQTANTS